VLVVLAVETKVVQLLWLRNSTDRWLHEYLLFCLAHPLAGKISAAKLPFEFKSFLVEDAKRL